jgi:hypothetical protein
MANEATLLKFFSAKAFSNSPRGKTFLSCGSVQFYGRARLLLAVRHIADKSDQTHENEGLCSFFQ